ncbi:hypothetical protein [Oerskovia sp. USHLN155]|uniref:hypothetical protein n=1 Tax=Oerskovia sp. USHLN155 TaxID=3081288 RepID=UPI0030192F0C
MHWYVAITEQTHPAFFEEARAVRPALRVRAVDAASVTGRESFRELIDSGFGRQRTDVGPDMSVRIRHAWSSGRTVADLAAIESELADFEPAGFSLAI